MGLLLLDISKLEGSNTVSALIEVKLTPERRGLTTYRRIAKFDEVESCMLMVELIPLLVISGSSLRCGNLRCGKIKHLMELSLQLLFQLKSYKSNGFLSESESSGDRLAVTLRELVV